MGNVGESGRGRREPRQYRPRTHGDRPRGPPGCTAMCSIPSRSRARPTGTGNLMPHEHAIVAERVRPALAALWVDSRGLMDAPQATVSRSGPSGSAKPHSPEPPCHRQSSESPDHGAGARGLSRPRRRQGVRKPAAAVNRCGRSCLFAYRRASRPTEPQVTEIIQTTVSSGMENEDTKKLIYFVALVSTQTSPTCVA